MSDRRLFIITGLSGAGKSQTLKIFEDFGFFCVDNLPVEMISAFADLVLRSAEHKQVALGLDIRSQDFMKNFAEVLEDLRRRELNCRVLFLDATEKVLVQRFSETRHRHPLGKNTLEAIKDERKILSNVKTHADRIIDTSGLTLGELKEKISNALEMKRTREMQLSIVSFGYKHGMPIDADIVWDVRFLPNPFYRPLLKKKTGLDPAVAAYIMKQPKSRPFLDRFLKMVTFLLPDYIREGKSYLTIAIGCTGGKHRSVFVARWLKRALSQEGYSPQEFHRDLTR
ncbi:MAG: RNase adapter RapZ [Elusimicrobia bacterium]|nr:MAG: RNase adapter RapZ [Elusimicrobiota bacterium]